MVFLRVCQSSVRRCAWLTQTDVTWRERLVRNTQHNKRSQTTYCNRTAVFYHSEWVICSLINQIAFQSFSKFSPLLLISPHTHSNYGVTCRDASCATKLTWAQSPDITHLLYHRSMSQCVLVQGEKLTLWSPIKVHRTLFKENFKRTMYNTCLLIWILHHMSVVYHIAITYLDNSRLCVHFPWLFIGG